MVVARAAILLMVVARAAILLSGYSAVPRRVYHSSVI